MSEYWLARNGQQYGPYSVDNLRWMYAEGHTTAADSVWTYGMPAWTPVAGLLGNRSAAPVGVQDGSTPQNGNVQGYRGAPAAATQGRPPELHWALVMLFSVVTLGIFYWVWFFLQANYVRRITGSNSPTVLAAIGVFLDVTRRVVDITFANSNMNDLQVGLIFVELGLVLAMMIFNCTAQFQMRSALLDYFNVTEPIALRLSGPMTFFFGMLYLQHHLTRISNWKRTGYLGPQ